jgi:adenylate cyclase
VIAEIEPESEDEPFARPDWLGDEVTHDPRYYNFRLSVQPYRQWAQQR